MVNKVSSPSVERNSVDRLINSGLSGSDRLALQAGVSVSTTSSGVGLKS